MKRVIMGAVTIGVTGGALALYGNNKIQEVVELKKNSPASGPGPAVVAGKTAPPLLLRAACLVGPGGKPCGSEIGQGNESSVETKEVPGPSVSGTVMFEDDGKECKITYAVTGLSPGKHGFHIHEKADFSNGCISAGPHYNPHNATHGGPDGDIESRHVGDLGNMLADESGCARGSISDKLIKLSGEYSVVGRSVIIHADCDDLGEGGHTLSSTTGNAGARVACGEIRKLKRVS